MFRQRYCGLRRSTHEKWLIPISKSIDIYEIQYPSLRTTPENPICSCGSSCMSFAVITIQLCWTLSPPDQLICIRNLQIDDQNPTILCWLHHAYCMLGLPLPSFAPNFHDVPDPPCSQCHHTVLDLGLVLFCTLICTLICCARFFCTLFFRTLFFCIVFCIIFCLSFFTFLSFSFAFIV